VEWSRPAGGPAGAQGEGRSPRSARPVRRNLTKLAAEGKLARSSVAETEIERIMQIPLRRTKNNPVLVGEPGVGKTAVVEGLARDHERRRAELLKNKARSTRSTWRRWSPARSTAAS